MKGYFNPENQKKARLYAVAMSKKRNKGDKVKKEIIKTIEFAMCTVLNITEIQGLLHSAIKELGDVYAQHTFR